MRKILVSISAAVAVLAVVSLSSFGAVVYQQNQSRQEVQAQEPGLSNEELREEVSRLTAQRDALVRQVSEHEASLEDLAGEVAVKNQELTATQQNLEAKTRELAQAKQVPSNDPEVARLNQQIGQLNGQIERTKKEYSVIETKYQELNTSYWQLMDNSNETMSQMTQDYEAIRVAFNQAEDEREQLVQEVAAKTQQIERLGQNMAEFRTTFNEREKVSAGYQLENARLKGEVQTMQTSAQSLTTDIYGMYQQVSAMSCPPPPAACDFWCKMGGVLNAIGPLLPYLLAMAGEVDADNTTTYQLPAYLQQLNEMQQDPKIAPYIYR